MGQRYNDVAHNVGGRAQSLKKGEERRAGNNIQMNGKQAHQTAAALVGLEADVFRRNAILQGRGLLQDLGPYDDHGSGIVTPCRNDPTHDPHRFQTFKRSKERVFGRSVRGSRWVGELPLVTFCLSESDKNFLGGTPTTHT